MRGCGKTPEGARLRGGGVVQRVSLKEHGSGNACERWLLFRGRERVDRCCRAARPCMDAAAIGVTAAM